MPPDSALTDTASPPTSSSAAALVCATPDELAAAAQRAVTAAQQAVARIAGGIAEVDELLDTYDDATTALADAAAVADLVTKAHPDARMRVAAEQAQQLVQRHTTEIDLNRNVQQALAGLDRSGMAPATRHWVERTLQKFRRAGVDRDDATRDRVRQLRQELVETGQAFARNINSDTRSAQLPPAALAGLPADWVRGHPAGPDGTVTVTTDNPDVVPVLNYCHDPAVREQLLRLWRQRGHPANLEVLQRMLRLRHELATLLGYPSWAAYVTEDKMIGTEDAAAEFITRVSQLATPRMRRDYTALLARKQADDPGATAVDPWDNRYLIERVRAERYALDSQALRPYFEYGRVRDGLMAVAARLFGVEFRARTDVPVWHPEVTAYDVLEHGTLLGRIFLDMHPRPDKFSHAAMYSMATGKVVETEAGQTTVRVPECALLCNFPRPGELLEHRNVETFFHEFGHLLHHVLSGRQRWSGVAGIKTEWDFVEAPSQLLEEWTLDATTLATFAVHHETGEAIPAELVERLRAADGFGTGVWACQQMFYAELSLELHRGDPEGRDPLAIEQQAQRRHTPFPHMPETWLHLSFGHLDGYSAIYYTYLWSLVIAKDLFTAFGPDLLDPEAAARYRRAVLAPGGAAPAAQLVRDFLGRDYTFDAFGRWLDEQPD